MALLKRKAALFTGTNNTYSQLSRTARLGFFCHHPQPFQKATWLSLVTGCNCWVSTSTMNGGTGECLAGWQRELYTCIPGAGFKDHHQAVVFMPCRGSWTEAGARASAAEHGWPGATVTAGHGPPGRLPLAPLARQHPLCIRSLHDRSRWVSSTPAWPAHLIHFIDRCSLSDCIRSLAPLARQHPLWVRSLHDRFGRASSTPVWPAHLIHFMNR